ncbi:MAG: PASTA domain-containing protein, partial [Acidimicrobiales bacterium]
RVDVYSNTTSDGLVMSVDPEPGTEVARGTVVTLTVSRGPEPITVPDVAGSNLSSAVETLEAVGLCIGETDGPANTPVIATDPPAGTVVFVGTCVRIVTSTALGSG